MRRAPREVYRVYDAEEYLTGVELDEPVDAMQQRVGGRRPHQIAGAMILVAAMGALGAVLAIVGLSPIGVGRRARSGALVATGSTTGSGATRGQLRQKRPSSRQARLRRAHRRDPGRKPHRPDTDTRARAFAAALPRRGVQSAPARAVEVADAAARQPGAHPQLAEFGFER